MLNKSVKESALPKPGDFPLGSLHSRVAARLLVERPGPHLIVNLSSLTPERAREVLEKVGVQVPADLTKVDLGRLTVAR